MAPLFMTVTGLSDGELPQSTCPDGVLILKIPGLCVGGTVDPRIQNCGYVAFIRSRKDGSANEESPEMTVCRYYRTNILLPWIEELRFIVHNHPSDAPVPDELTTVAWLDGGMPQLAVVVTEEMQSQDAERKVLTCKHAAAATAVEQPCDTSAAFRTMKRLEAVSTSAAFRTMKRLEAVSIADTQSSVVLKSQVQHIFRDNEDKLKLRAANQRVLVDFLVRVQP